MPGIRFPEGEQRKLLKPPPLQTRTPYENLSPCPPPRLSLVPVFRRYEPDPTRPVSRAHAELTTYGFPIGLLPAAVQAYSINATSGDFYVDLHGPCGLTLPPANYLAAYSEKITGRIVRGRIAGLGGIRVRALFRWWSITGIKSRGENLVFEVGSVSAKYTSKNFDEAPVCEGGKRASS